jgi:radical SAM protein with 4Fe4S-binding SPASM domain
MDVVAGSVREAGGFTAVWQDSKVLLALRDPARLGGRCGVCEFQDLCGGCRCRAQAAFGDYLAEDPACTYQPTGQPIEVAPLIWHPEARARLERIPIRFVRQKVEKGLEAFAHSHGLVEITPEVMKEGMQGDGRDSMLSRMPSFLRKP